MRTYAVFGNLSHRGARRCHINHSLVPYRGGFVLAVRIRWRRRRRVPLDQSEEEKKEMSPEIVKPFKLSEGCYVVSNRDELIGPLSGGNVGAEPEYFYATLSEQSSACWLKNGAPAFTRPDDLAIRIGSIITGPVGMLAYIDKMSLREDQFAKQQVNHARAALATLIRKDDPDYEEPVKTIEAELVGEAAERVLEVMLRDIIREEMRAIIREEIPAIVAESCNPFDGSELRLAVSVTPLRA